MAEKCEVCGLTEFTAEAGFYYCVECGTKSQRHGPELVDEAMDNLPSQGATAVKIKKAKKINRITSWEQANYILLGYTERLVALGAGDGLKLTVLQLWTTYLRRMEVAFFSKTKPERPRLHVFHRKIDADIIYSRKRNRKKQCRKKVPAGSEVDGSSSVVNRLASIRKNRADQRSLLSAEYASYRTSQLSDVNTSLHELSVQSINSSRSEAAAEKTTARRLQYSRSARVHMKRKLKMSTAHIDRHEKDVGEKMSCHQLQKGVHKRKLNTVDPKVQRFSPGNPENLTGSLLLSILGLGLNVSQSELQLADLMRFYREEHLPRVKLVQYLPENLDPSCYKEVLNTLQNTTTSHEELRKAVASLSNFLHVEPITPNLLKLCKRYLEELCLPMDILTYIERLMAVFPPQIKFDGGFKLPNFEGRCMAFIIFILKLLFGLNGCTEEKMSKSAAKLNRAMKALGLFDTPVFVFTEWLRYLEMRKVILSQVNYPINRQSAQDDGTEQDPALFIDYMMKKQNADDTVPVNSGFNKAYMSKLKETVTNVLDTHHRQGLTRDSCSHIEFEPSVTPYKSYLEQFILAHNKNEKIHVPNYMQIDHTNRIVSAFVDSAELKYLLLTNHQLKLVTKKAPPALNLFEFVKSTVVTEFLSNKERREAPFMVAEHCSEADWNPQETLATPGPSEANTHDTLLDKIIIRNEMEKLRTDMIVSSRKKNAELSHSVSEQPNENSAFAESSSELFSQQSVSIAPNQTAETIPSGKGESINLLTPNYDYWVRFYGNGEAYSRETFNERVAVGLPDNFRLVLEECARVVETWPHLLYQELMTLETYFFYVVQPVERFFPPTNPDEPTEVLFESTRPLNTNQKRTYFAKKKY